MHQHGDKIEEQLERILESSEFSRAGKMSFFLRHLVTHELQEPASPLRERSIGIEVFDRPADWDPKVDNVVRSEARRLRARLNSYYERVGSKDQVRIEIPKGGYQPRFEVAPEPQPTGAEPASATQGKGNTPRRWIAGSLALLVTVLAAVIFGRGAFQNKIAAYRSVPFADEFGPEFSPTIAPDGKQIAYVWDGNQNSLRIWIKNVNGDAPRRLTEGDSTELDPAWSPDGQAIAFLRLSSSHSQIVVRDLETKSSSVLGEISAHPGIWASSPGPLTGGQGPAWFPDRKSIAVSDSFGQAGAIALFELTIAATARQQLTNPAPGQADLYPTVSPNGKYLAFARYSTHGVCDLFMLTLHGNTVERLSTDGRSIRGIAWEPDGRHILIASNRAGGFGLWSVDWKSKRIVPVPIATSAAAEPDIVRSGAWLAFVEMKENWNIWRVRLDHSGTFSPERFISSSGRNHSATYSPDGKRIAFVSDRSGNWEIWLGNRDGTDLRQLTHFNGPWIGGLAWSPDANSIAFDARPGLHSQIYLVSANDGTTHPIEQSNHEERMPLWTRDGQSIFYNSDQTGEVAIWQWNLKAGQKREIASGGFLIRAMEDGNPVYYDAQARAFKKLTMANGTLSTIASGIAPATVLSWTVSDNNIFFVTRENAVFSLWSFDIPFQRSRKIGDLRFPIGTNTPSLTISPDGTWLLFEQQESVSSDIYTAHK